MIYLHLLAIVLHFWFENLPKVCHVSPKVSNKCSPQQAEFKKEGAAVRRPQGVFFNGGVREPISAGNQGRGQGPGAGGAADRSAHSAGLV